MRAALRVFIGWDSAQIRAWNVAQWSAMLTVRGVALDIRRIAMAELQARGCYHRPTETRDGRLWDVLSEAPMATGHAIARFFVPLLCNHEGWALFTDGDVLFRRDVAELFALADPQYAVQVVQHAHVPTTTTKMAGQIQTAYPRKNWSSVVLWNCGHPAHAALTLDLLNTVPGRDLHRFCWLTDDRIGALPPEWNWLVGHSPPDIDPALVHFTDGLPDQAGYEHVAYAQDWWRVARYAGYTRADFPHISQEAAV
jgi:hypothetical protein